MLLAKLNELTRVIVEAAEDLMLGSDIVCTPSQSLKKIIIVFCTFLRIAM